MTHPPTIRRALPGLLLVVLCALAGPVTAASAGARRAHAAVLTCHQGVLPQARYATVQASMTAGARSDRLAIRFELLRLGPDGTTFTPIAAPKLGAWIQADAGVGRFKLRRRVSNLTVPGVFRARVTFRWTDAAGRQLGQVSRTTAACHQPDLRPDLRVAGVRILPLGQDGRRSYVIAILNAGRTDARGFSVFLNRDGQPVAQRFLQRVQPGERRRVVLTGPDCAGVAGLAAVLDPSAHVAESDETNNAVSVGCPAPPPA